MTSETTDLSSAQFHPALGPIEPSIQLVLGLFVLNQSAGGYEAGRALSLVRRLRASMALCVFKAGCLVLGQLSSQPGVCIYIMSHFIADVSCGSLSYVVTVNTNWGQRSATSVLK
jgi:hypothetical protein